MSIYLIPETVEASGYGPYMWVSPTDVPNNGWFIMKNPVHPF